MRGPNCHHVATLPARALVLALAAALALAGPAQAHAHHVEAPMAACPPGVPVQPITVVNDAHVRPRVLERVERAVAEQSLVVRRYWQTPCIRFGPGGWPLTIVPKMPAIPGEPAGVAGVHGYGPAGDIGTAGPWLLAETYGASAEAWSENFSHEVIEVIVDPNVNRYIDGTLVEPCDPVEDQPGYQAANGIWLSDFVFPAWFVSGSRGPWDYLRLTRGPGDLSNGDAP